jgi:signal transduction histidine kinase
MLGKETHIPTGPDGAPIAWPTVWRRAIVATLVASGVLGLLAAVALRQELQHRRELVTHEGSYVVSLEREFLELELRAVRSDLLFLAQQALLERFVTGDEAARPELEREYAGFARSKPLYDQIRLLDAKGHEVVRINRRGENVETVRPEDLQAKASRYYFRQAIDLAPGRIFVSPLDLNVERGEIERPLQPVIRLATPVAGGSRERRGLLVLNYNGTRLLGKLREIAEASRGDVMLVDLQGQYLQAPDASRQWGWLLGHSASFERDHPEAWRQIRSEPQSQVQIAGDLFTAEQVSFAESDAGAKGAVLIVSRLPIGDASSWATGPGRAWAGTGAFVAIAILSFYWALSSEQRGIQDRRIAASEARLRLLSTRLLAAQEEERRSLSRRLHDELGQRATAIALDLKAALRRHVDDAEPTLRRAAQEADGLLASLHEIATQVRPSVLDDLGLADAIESYASEYRDRTGVSVHLDVRLADEEPSRPVAENLYRILQEGLANVATHAQTAAARVRLIGGEDGLVLTVEDDGCGFGPATLVDSNRLGILGMRERVELLGGEFEIETAPSQGTRIRVRLPASAGEPREGDG